MDFTVKPNGVEKNPTHYHLTLADGTVATLVKGTHRVSHRGHRVTRTHYAIWSINGEWGSCPFGSASTLKGAASEVARLVKRSAS